VTKVLFDTLIGPSNKIENLKAQISDPKFVSMEEDSDESEGEDSKLKQKQDLLKDILAESDSEEDEKVKVKKSKKIVDEIKPSNTKEEKVDTKEEIKVKEDDKQKELSSKEKILEDILRECYDEPEESTKPPRKVVPSKLSPVHKEEAIDNNLVISTENKLLDIINEYENATRLTVLKKEVIGPIQEKMSKTNIKVSRMAYMPLKSISAVLTNPENEKTFGRPSCISVRFELIPSSTLTITFMLEQRWEW